MKYVLLLLSFAVFLRTAEAKTCLYVNSYHKGYAWSDRIEQSVRQGLKNHCQLTVFYMDTKRHTAASFGQKKALAAKALIEKIKPDVVIVSDDNASKYLVAPYYKDARLPFVFCGINWSAKAYGYPYSNATGMIEVSAIKALLRTARAALGVVKTVAFIGVQGVRTDEKEFAWLKKSYAGEDVNVVAFYVKTMAEWQEAYVQAQKHDFIVLNNVAGIQDWKQEHAASFATKHAGTLTVTTYDFMTPYTMLAMTKLAEEQGEWAAQLAVQVLQGKTLANIPVVVNRRWNMFINPAILQASSVHLPSSILFKAVKVQ